MFSTSFVPCSDLSQAGKVVASKLFKKKKHKLFKRTAEKGEAVPHSQQAPVGLLNARGWGRGVPLGESRERAERKQKGLSTQISGDGMSGHPLEKGRIKRDVFPPLNSQPNAKGLLGH